MAILSIIIPVYNTEKYLVRCLESICSLRNDAYVILVDDGSTDSSGMICDSYVKKNKHFSVVHKCNEGLVLARKSGIDLVKTEYFTFIDSDDYIDPNAYDEMIDDLLVGTQKNADILCAGLIEEYLGDCYPKFNNFPVGIYSEDSLNELLCGMLSKGPFFNFGILPNTVCKIYKTAFVRNNPISISSNVRIGEDADMTFQFMAKAKVVMVSDHTSYHYCRREGSMMWKKIASEAIDCLECDLRKAFEKIPNYKEHMMNQLDDYMSFILLICAPQRLLNRDQFFAETQDRIALYGAGGVGKAIRYGMNNRFSLWVDKNHMNYCNDEILPIERLVTDQNSYDKVFIAMSNVETCQKIKKQLHEMGIRKPIYYYRCEEKLGE